MCGILGLFAGARAAYEAADALLVLQHRGQDAAGIATFDGESFHVERASGSCASASDEHGPLRLLPGRFAIGHTRYPTVGSGTAQDAQPLYTNSPYGIVMAHNGNVTNYVELKPRAEGERRRSLATECDVEAI